MKPIFKSLTASIINYTFQAVLILYLVLLLTEQIWTGFVSLYINLNYLLIIVIIFGILDVFSEHQPKKRQRIKKRDYYFIYILGIIGFIIIKYKTPELGWLSWLISIIVGILIILLSRLILEEDEEDTESGSDRPIIKREIYVRRKSFYAKIILGILLLMLLISVILTLFSSLTLIASLRIIYGSIYVLFIPGFILSFVFFKPGKIDIIERIALSFALSIAVVPLFVFYLNLIGVKINLLNSFFIILGIILISGIILIIQKKYNQKHL